EWAPDSRALAVDKSDVFVKDRRGLVVGAPHGAAQGGDGERHPADVTPQWSVAWAPGGDGVFALSARDEDYHIYLISAPGAAPARVTQGSWAVSDFRVFPDAHAIYFVANEGRPEERHIYRVGLDGGSVTRISQRPGTHAPVFSPDGRFA